ncbi:MAG: hypothetical protein AAGJ82_08190 [Bacteroidota bacterium]
MKKLLHLPIPTLWSLLLFMALLGTGCPETITIEEPPTPPIVQDLGLHQLSTDARQFVPYQSVRELVFIGADSTFYDFTMTAPLYETNKVFTETFPHPTLEGQNVTYSFTTDVQRYSWVCNELGAIIEVEVRGDFCDDPKLKTEGILFDYLRIRGTGFNHGDLTLATPSIWYNLTTNSFCGDGQLLPTYTALGYEYSQVFRQSVDVYSNGYLRLYFNESLGIVAFDFPGIFAVLDERF